MRRFAFVLACAAPVTAAPAPVSPASFERSVLTELNRARARPGEIAQELRLYRTTLRGLVSYTPGRNERMMTKEGAAAVDEAIAFLEQQAPMPALADSGVLGKAASALMEEQARTGSIGHGSSYGRGPGARALAVGGGDAVSETIAYGYRDPAAVVHQLIVDDGVPDRGHRVLIFAQQFRFAGVGCATHPRFRHACTIDFAATPDGRRESQTYASR